VASQSLVVRPELSLFLVCVGAIFVGIGLVLATDFRGFTSWHVGTTVRMMRRVTNSNRSSLDDRQVTQMGLERAMGVVVAAVGLLPVGVGLVELVRWAAS
jgi:hypothetical protein